MKKLFFFLVLTVMNGFSFEDDVITGVQNKSRAFFSAYHRAKLELYFNQPKYAPGDTAYLRMTYVTAQDLKPIRGRQVVHLGVYDHAGNKVLTQWAAVNNGSANCQLPIPFDFPPGNYVLVAFTDWMKNLDPSLFFRQQFQVAGKYSIVKTFPADTLSFYPEGGNLVAGVENNVAVWYRGNDSEATAVIKEEGNVIATISLKRDSVSTILLAPKNIARYTAELRGRAASKEFYFPALKKDGVALSLDASQNKLTLTARLPTEAQISGGIYLAVFSSAGLVFSRALDFVAQSASVELPADLPAGIMQLMVFDSKLKLLASRVIHHGEVVRQKVTIRNLQENYTTRQVVKANLQIDEESGYNLPGQFTCRVINEELLPENSPRPMDYLTFRSDLTGTLDYLQRSRSPMTINTYLITQTCPWVDWNKIMAGAPAPVHRRQEYLSLSGKAMFAQNKKPVKDSTLLMFMLKKSLQEYEAYVTKQGEFSLSLLLMVDPRDSLFYTASFHGSDLDDVLIKMHDPDSSVSFSADPWRFENNVPDPYATYSAKRNTVARSFAFFVNTKTQKDSIEDKNAAMEEELNGADVVLNLSDYLQMPTMNDVVRELLKFVEHRKVNGRDVIRMYTTTRMPNNKTGPIFVIDGQITKDPSFFLSLAPSDVVYIKLVNNSGKLYALGQLGNNGVILVKTRSQRVVINDSHKINFSGFLPFSKFPSLGNGNAQIPDFRSCLFWSQRIFLRGAMHQEISFTTLDDVGKFKLQVFGVGEDGTPFYAEQPFTVKFSGTR
jgi:hypothetical protein